MGGHLAADRDRPEGPCRTHDVMDRAHHRRVQRLVEGADPRVGPIDRQQVLDEVVRANADELDVAREKIGGQGGTGDLDGESDGQVLAKGLALAPKLGLRIFHEAEGQVEIGGAGREGKHHPERSVGPGSQERAHLDPKRLGKTPHQSQGPLAERGVGARGGRRAPSRRDPRPRSGP